MGLAVLSFLRDIEYLTLKTLQLTTMTSGGSKGEVQPTQNCELKMGEGRFNVDKIPSYSCHVSECVLVCNFTTGSVTTAGLFPKCVESVKRESERIKKGEANP